MPSAGASSGTFVLLLLQGGTELVFPGIDAAVALLAMCDDLLVSGGLAAHWEV